MFPHAACPARLTTLFFFSPPQFPRNAMPSCPLCVTDFPALSIDTVCKRCTALQALGVSPEHANYIYTQASVARSPIFWALTMPTQGWKQCLHCGISAPHLGTAPNVPRTVCLSPGCVAWATSFTDGERVLMQREYYFVCNPLDPYFSGENVTLLPPPSISAATEQRVLAAHARLKRFPPSTTTVTAAALKPRSASGSAFAEKMVTVAYNVTHPPSCPNHG